MGEPAFDINSVYRYLVPEEYKSQLRAIGVIGGISAAVSAASFALKEYSNQVPSRTLSLICRPFSFIRAKPKRQWRILTVLRMII
jgi:hypothetical protein